MVHCSHKGMDMVSNNTQIGCGVNNAKLVLSVPKKYPPHHYITTTSLNRWDKAGWIHSFIFMPNSDPTIWMLQQKTRLIRPGNVFPILYCPILLSLCELHPPFPALSWQERHPVWSSAAVADLLQGLTCTSSNYFICPQWGNTLCNR